MLDYGEKETELYRMAEAGNVARMQALLEAGADPATALHKAARNGHADCVQALLRAGAQINAQNHLGVTALIEAVEQNHLECVQTLLGSSADPNIKTHDCYDDDGTALHIAAIKGHTACVKALIQAGADVHVVVEGDQTALIWAARNGHVECVEALIQAGADVHVVVEGDKTALIAAARNGHAACVEALIQAGVAVNAENAEGETALIVAARNSHVECVEALLVAGATVNAKEQNGCTALMYAAQEGHTACVRALLGAGADPDSTNALGNTALHGAAKKGCADCVQALLEAGADLNLVNKQSAGVLHLAAYHGRLECVQALLLYLSREAIYAKNGNGQTALEISQQKGFTELERWLNSADQIQQSIASLRQTLQAPASIKNQIPSNLTVTPQSIQLTDSITLKLEPDQAPCLAITNDDPNGRELQIPLKLLPTDLLYLLAPKPIQVFLEPDGIMVLLFEQYKTPLECLLKKLNPQDQQDLKDAYQASYSLTWENGQDTGTNTLSCACTIKDIQPDMPLSLNIDGVPLETSPQFVQFSTPHAEGFFQKMSSLHKDRNTATLPILAANDSTEDTEPQNPSLDALPFELIQQIFALLNIKSIQACFMTGSRGLRLLSSPVRSIQFHHQLMFLRPPCRLRDHTPGVAATQLEAQQHHAVPRT